MESGFGASLVEDALAGPDRSSDRVRAGHLSRGSVRALVTCFASSSKLVGAHVACSLAAARCAGTCVRRASPRSRQRAPRCSQREREEKSQALTPPEIGRVERALLSLENGRFFERLLAPPEGFYPKIGNITSGSGFTVGPAYRQPASLRRAGATSPRFAAVSIKRYWMLDARLTLPELADGRVFADVHGQLFEFPSEQFFGIGPGVATRDEDGRIRLSGAHRLGRPEESGRCRGCRSEQLWTS